MNDETIYSVDDSRERIVAWLEDPVYGNRLKKRIIQWHALIDLYDSVPLCGISENHQVDLYFEEREWDIHRAARFDLGNGDDEETSLLVDLLERHLRRLSLHSSHFCELDNWRWRRADYPKVHGDTVNYSPAYLGMVEPKVPTETQMERD